MNWPLLVVASLALLASLAGALFPRSLLGQLRVWLGLTAFVSFGAYVCTRHKGVEKAAASVGLRLARLFPTARLRPFA